MCHQSVGLIARHLEANGIATVSMSSAWSVTASVKPPRSVYLDYPLGHTAGPPDDASTQLDIARRTIGLFESATRSGMITPLPHVWPTAWKAAERKSRSGGPRRTPTPQYQFDEDREIAARRYGPELAVEASDSSHVPAD